MGYCWILWEIVKITDEKKVFILLFSCIWLHEKLISTFVKGKLSIEIAKNSH